MLPEVDHVQCILRYLLVVKHYFYWAVSKYQACVEMEVMCAMVAFRINQLCPYIIIVEELL